VSTIEVAQAREKLAEAKRCIEDSQRDATTRRQDLDRALAKLQQCRFDAARRENELERAMSHQQNLQVQLAQINRVLGSGGAQTRLGGSVRDLQKQRRILEAALRAAPG
jgi:chromosome segregation ATPase